MVTVVSGCLEDQYHCSSNADCDLGVAGRCETDHVCTAYDPTCPTDHRYTAHSGAASGTCFDDRVAVARCAPGQPPALLDGCTTSVCGSLPACCTTAWTDACVELAQQEPACGICDTQIALVAARGGTIETWVATYNGATWTGVRHPEAISLSWLAPAPGTSTPRLAAVDPSGTKIQIDGGDVLAFPADHHIQDVSSVDFDRDGRDTIAVSYIDDQVPSTNQLVIVKLDDGSLRELGELDATQRLSWGDYDHDAFPDAVGGTGNRYTFFGNAEPADASHVRILNDVGRKTMPMNMVNSTPGIRSIDWADLDHDGTSDVAVFGSAVRLHLGGNVIDQNQVGSIDCDPPSLVAACTDNEFTSLSGATLYTPGAAQVLFSIDYEKTAPVVAPTRNFYRVTTDALATPQPILFTTGCGASCQPIHAVVARDLDGDHLLDVLAIDAQLMMYQMLGHAPKLAALTTPPIVTSNDPAKPFTVVRVSVTGAPR